MAWTNQYSEEDCIRALQRVAKLIGRTPYSDPNAGPDSYARWHAPDEPSAVTIQTYFGSWNEAIIAAGLKPNSRGRRRDPDYLKHSDDEMLAAVRKAATKLPDGQHLSVARYEEVREDSDPCDAGIRRRLRKPVGTWRSILEAAGVD